MEWPVFRRTSRYNVIGWQTPFGRRDSGFVITFWPGNVAAWVLLAGLVALTALAYWGGPLVFGPALLFGADTVPTGLFLGILVCALSLIVVFVFSEADEGDSEENQ